jgi:hypothetical protein
MKKRLLFSILLSSMLLACKSLSLPFAPTAAPPEITLLTEVLQKSEECRSDAGVEVQENKTSFSCSNSADTFYIVSITRFDNQEVAHAQFESERGDNPVVCFHGYDLYESSSTNPNNRFIVEEQLSWQVGQWVISIGDSYDYGYFHFTARGFSEEIYASGVAHELFLAGTCP